MPPALVVTPLHPASSSLAPTGENCGPRNTPALASSSCPQGKASGRPDENQARTTPPFLQKGPQTPAKGPRLLRSPSRPCLIFPTSQPATSPFLSSKVGPGSVTPHPHLFFLFLPFTYRPPLQLLIHPSQRQSVEPSSINSRQQSLVCESLTPTYPLPPPRGNIRAFLGSGVVCVSGDSLSAQAGLPFVPTPGWDQAWTLTWLPPSHQMLWLRLTPTDVPFQA